MTALVSPRGPGHTVPVRDPAEDGMRRLLVLGCPAARGGGLPCPQLADGLHHLDKPGLCRGERPGRRFRDLAVSLNFDIRVIAERDGGAAQAPPDGAVRLRLAMRGEQSVHHLAHRLGPWLDRRQHPTGQAGRVVGPGRNGDGLLHLQSATQRRHRQRGRRAAHCPTLPRSSASSIIIASRVRVRLPTWRSITVSPRRVTSVGTPRTANA